MINNVLAVVVCIQMIISSIGVAQNKYSDSCRFVDFDPQKAASELRSEDPPPADLFIKDLHNAFSSHKAYALFVGNERRESFFIYDLPYARTLDSIERHLRWQLLQDTIDNAEGKPIPQSLWQAFLDALEQLTCDEIYRNGIPTKGSVNRLANFIEAARLAALRATTYDAGYYKLDSVFGDIQKDRGVCSDVVVRALLKVGIDLQERVNQDIRNNPVLYNLEQWGQSGPDRNIDHRRVKNLVVYFSNDRADFACLEPPDRNWEPGDIVVWNLQGDQGFLPHIGVISDSKTLAGNLLVIHHFPPSGSEEDVLHKWQIVYHFRPLF